MHLISHHALNANSTGTSMPHAQHIALSAVSDDFPACICEAFSFLFFFMGVHSSIYFLYLLLSAILLASFFFCLLSHQLSCSPDHAQQVFRSPTDEMKVGMEEKVEGEVEWVWLEEEKKRKSSAVKQKCVWNLHNRGRSFLGFFTLVFYNKQQKLHYFKNTWSMTWGIVFVFLLMNWDYS